MRSARVRSLQRGLSAGGEDQISLHYLCGCSEGGCRLALPPLFVWMHQRSQSAEELVDRKSDTLVLDNIGVPQKAFFAQMCKINTGWGAHTVTDRN